MKWSCTKELEKDKSLYKNCIENKKQKSNFQFIDLLIFLYVATDKFTM